MDYLCSFVPKDVQATFTAVIVAPLNGSHQLNSRFALPPGVVFKEQTLRIVADERLQGHIGLSNVSGGLSIRPTLALSRILQEAGYISKASKQKAWGHLVLGYGSTLIGGPQQAMAMIFKTKKDVPYRLRGCKLYGGDKEIYYDQKKLNELQVQ
jgi:hypothetical protein